MLKMTYESPKADFYNLFRQQSVGVLTAVTARKIRFILWEITLLDTLSRYFVVFIDQFIIARDNFFQQLLLMRHLGPEFLPLFT